MSRVSQVYLPVETVGTPYNSKPQNSHTTTGAFSGITSADLKAAVPGVDLTQTAQVSGIYASVDGCVQPNMTPSVYALKK